MNDIEADDLSNLFYIERVRGRISEVLDKVELTPLEIYAHLPQQFQTPENQAQVEGWFDGTVKASPKSLVTAFFFATIKAIERLPSVTDQTYLSDYQPTLHPIQ